MEKPHPLTALTRDLRLAAWLLPRSAQPRASGLIAGNLVVNRQLGRPRIMPFFSFLIGKAEHAEMTVFDNLSFY